MDTVRRWALIASFALSLAIGHVEVWDALPDTGIPEGWSTYAMADGALDAICVPCALAGGGWSTLVLTEIGWE